MHEALTTSRTVFSVLVISTSFGINQHCVLYFSFGRPLRKMDTAGTNMSKLWL